MILPRLWPLKSFFPQPFGNNVNMSQSWCANITRPTLLASCMQLRRTLHACSWEEHSAWDYDQQYKNSSVLNLIFGRPHQHSCMVMLIQRQRWGISTAERKRYHLIYIIFVLGREFERISPTWPPHSHPNANLQSLFWTNKETPLYESWRRIQTKCFFLSGHINQRCWSAFDLARQETDLSHLYRLLSSDSLSVGFLKLC